MARKKRLFPFSCLFFTRWLGVFSSLFKILRWLCPAYNCKAEEWWRYCGFTPMSSALSLWLIRKNLAGATAHGLCSCRLRKSLILRNDSVCCDAPAPVLAEWPVRNRDTFFFIVLTSFHCHEDWGWFRFLIEEESNRSSSTWRDGDRGDCFEVAIRRISRILRSCDLDVLRGNRTLMQQRKVIARNYWLRCQYCFIRQPAHFPVRCR